MVRFEPKYSLSDLDDNEMKEVYEKLKNNKDIDLNCRREQRIGELKVSMPMHEPYPPEEKHLHLLLCEIWDEEWDIAQLILKRNGTIDTEDNEELINLRERLPFTKQSEPAPGYCISSEVQMPKTPQDLRTIIENNEQQMIIGSRKELDDIIEEYGGNKIGSPNWKWEHKR